MSSASELRPSVGEMSGRNDSQGFNIIIIPELGTGASKRSTDFLQQIEPKSRIYHYHYSIPPNEGTIWASLVQKGNEFLECIRTQPELSSRPVVCVCHGLGGIIAKRALGLLDERYWDDASKHLLHAQSGMIFLGTPHLTYTKQDLWQRMTMILKSCPGSSKWQSQDEISTIANVCTKFEEAGFNFHVLSAFETAESKVNDGLYKSRKLVTFATHETLVGIEADHLEIGDFTSARGIRDHLEAFFKNVQFSNSPESSGILERALDNITWTSTVSHVGEAEAMLTSQPDIPPALSEFTPAEATRGTSDKSNPEGHAIALDVHESRRPATLPCYLLDSQSQNPDFSGREELMRSMEQVLLPSNRSPIQKSGRPRAFALCGLGGVGKTQCALEFAISHRSEFDAVFWAQADSTPKLDESFSQISVALNLEESAKARDRVVSRNIVMEWLSNPVKTFETAFEVNLGLPRANWLLIFDNADDPALLADFWPASGTGSIILTSRDPMAKTYFFSSHGTDLEPLRVDAAAALLRKLTQSGSSTEEHQSSILVAKRMGGLPLAISLAAAAMTRQELTFDEFLTLYEAEPTAADVKRVSLRPEYQYQHTLSTVWALDTLSPGAASLLRLLSFMDPDAMDERIMTQNLPAALLPDFPNSDEAFIAARTILLKSSLIKRNKGLRQLSIHRLTQDFTRARMTSSESQALFGAALKLCRRFWPTPKIAFSWNVKDWNFSQHVVPHVLFLRNLWLRQRFLINGEETKRDLADLLWKVAWYFEERGSASPDAEALLHSCNDICDSESLRYSSIHANCVFALSTICNHQNVPQEALKYARHHIEIREHNHEKGQFPGIAYHQLGMTLCLNDKFDEAIQAFRKSLEVYQDWEDVATGAYRPDFPWAGLAYALSLVGKTQEGEEILLESIRIRAMMYGENDTESIKLGWIYQALGDIRFRQERWEVSFDSHRRALTNYLVTSGPRFFRMGQLCVKLGEHYTRMQEYDTADVYFIKALQIFQDRPCYKGEAARALQKQSRLWAAKAATILETTATAAASSITSTGTSSDSATAARGSGEEFAAAQQEQKNRAEEAQEQARNLEARAVELYEEVVKEGRYRGVYDPPLEVIGNGRVDFDRVVPYWAR